MGISRPLEIQPVPSTYPVLHQSYQRIQNVASFNSGSFCVNSYDRRTRRSPSWSPRSSSRGRSWSRSWSSSCNTWSEFGSHSAGGRSHQCITCHPCHHAHVVHNAPVHAVHSVQPVHSSFSVQADPHHAAVHNVVPVVPVVKAETNTIADMVATNPKFSTLFTAVKTAGLVDVLKSAGPFTVFAPTNTAFDKVPVDQLNALLADKEKLKGVLLRHVVTGSSMQGKNIPPGSTTLKTAGGEEITATRDKFIQINSSAGSAYIVLFDQLAGNGVVHAVDTVF